MPTLKELISDIDKLLDEACSPLTFMRDILSEGYQQSSVSSGCIDKMEIDSGQWNKMINDSIRKLEEMRDRVNRYVKEKKKLA